MPIADQPVRHAWIDASAGTAGDMLLGALLDAGAGLIAVQEAVRAVAGDDVSVAATSVTRAGLRSTLATVEIRHDDPPHRPWRTVRQMIMEAGLPDRVRDDAAAVFARLAAAEGRVHGIDPEEVTFHEVGALDSIADTVGTCAALHDLGVTAITASEVALGSGTARSAHGVIPVPVPAVVELARNWRVLAGGSGELTTPTGMALLATLAAEQTTLPAMRLDRVGIGAGSRDTPGRANVTRVLLGEVVARGAAPEEPTEEMTVLEANVDDLDPRLWPQVLSRLLDAGAADAWLQPMIMKKGRPAHTLSVLSQPSRAALLRELILVETTTLGVRQHPVSRYALPRIWEPVVLDGTTVRIKISHRDGVIIQATPEFEDVAAFAAARALPEQQALQQAQVAAAQRGLATGRRLPVETA